MISVFSKNRPKYAFFCLFFTLVFFMKGQNNNAFCTSLKETTHKTDEKKSTKTLKKKGKTKKVIHMNEIEIVGKVEKPKVMFIIPRTPHEFIQKKYEKDFSAEILAPINKQSVEGRQLWQENISGP